MRKTHWVLITGSSALGSALLLIAPALHAQDSLVEDKQATSGATDVAAEGFQKAEAIPAEDVRETSAKVMAGGLFSTGNAKALAATAGVVLRLRRGMNQYSADLAANYGRAAVDPDSKTETTVENYQGRVRYDRFLSKHWALFAQLTGRRDRFQDLDVRLNFDPGLALYAIADEKQHLSLEAGYDLQYDIRRREAVDAAQGTDEPINATETRHAVRLAIGYDNSLNEHVTFDTDLEYLQAFDPSKAFRINWVNYLTANIVNDLAFAAGFTLRYDNYPLPGVQKLDTITTLNLVYTLK